MAFAVLHYKFVAYLLIRAKAKTHATYATKKGYKGTPLRLFMGKIVFQTKGIFQLYSCSCGGDAEPSDAGVYCYTCGASASWPKRERIKFSDLGIE